MKAMILAAGRGERLRPLTDSLPKPLLRVGSHRLIEYHLYRLAKMGIRKVVINVSYLKDLIIETLGQGERYGLKIQYSEEPDILETGGGIFQALSLGLLDENPFLLLSADIWSEFDLNSLPRHLTGDAHLVLVDNPDFHAKGDFGLEEGQLNLNPPLFTYANVAILDPHLFTACTKGHFKLAPLLKRAIDAGHATGVHYRGPWFNVGTMDELNKLKQHLSLSSL